MYKSRYIVFSVVLAYLGLQCIYAALLPIRPFTSTTEEPKHSGVSIIATDCLVCNPRCWARCGTRRFKRCCKFYERRKRSVDLTPGDYFDLYHEKQ
ncbi:unnamed protein product [Allacma fusca]|uniref:Uncharacterized protein n=1 Tax=Allacma fusca TaxID=39272 RepID=A0A8J2JD63_9HEXA|nr:unnamed protein product [Allacma fusca]